MEGLSKIGPVEEVSFVDGKVQAVPAKIDTGADSSSVWASHIVENSGQLSFKLFGKASPFFSGQVHKTKDYKVVSVKNSFGHAEFRYKVKLRLNIAGRTVKATFSLADRSRNRYPVLIGRRTLQGKFVVDVRRTNLKQEFHVLMLSTKKTPATAQFAKNLERYGKKLRLTYASYEELCYRVGAPGNNITLLDSGRDVADFDLVHFKTSAHYQDIAAALANYLSKRGVMFIDQAVQHFPGSSKLYQYVQLTDHGIPVPRSIFIMPASLEKSYDLIRQELGLPFVLKDIHGNKGEHNFLIKDKAGFKKACRQAALNAVQCIAQAYVSNDQDYRVLVFGNKIAMVLKRARLDDTTHLNNTSQGAQASLIAPTELPARVQVDSLAAAKLLGRQVAGVDFVQDKSNGLWYCLEVNDGPQIATGKFRAEKHAAFAAYLERKLGK